MNETNTKNAKEWTPRQRLFIEWLALPSEARYPLNQGGFAKEIGVHESTLSDWKRLPGFGDAVKDLIMSRLGDDLHDVMHAFKQESKKGSFQHQKMYFEMLGMYVPKIAPTNPEGTEPYAGANDAQLIAKAAAIVARRTSDTDEADRG